MNCNLVKKKKENLANVAPQRFGVTVRLSNFPLAAMFIFAGLAKNHDFIAPLEVFKVWYFLILGYKSACNRL